MIKGFQSNVRSLGNEKAFLIQLPTFPGTSDKLSARTYIMHQKGSAIINPSDIAWSNQNLRILLENRQKPAN